MWQATVGVLVEWKNQQGTWSLGEETVSATGETQKDARERLGDVVAKVTRGIDRAYFASTAHWPPSATVISIDLTRAPELERI